MSTSLGKLSAPIEPAFYPDTGVQAQLLNIRALHAHHHPNSVELLYCLKGSVWGHIAHEKLELSAGNLVTFDRDDVHNVFSDEDNLCLIVHIDLSHPDYTAEEMHSTLFSCTTHPDYIRHPKGVEAVCDLLLSIMYTASSGAEDRKGICEEMRLHLLDLLMKKFSWFSIRGWDDEYAKYADRFQTIVKYIMENSHEKITISKLSELIYLNPSYISSFMRRTTFNSITEAVAYFRCYAAQKLLLETDMPVGDISKQCGFSSDKYFYRWFRYFWGTTPLQHRKLFARYLKQEEDYYEYTPSEAKAILQEYILRRQMQKALEPVDLSSLD